MNIDYYDYDKIIEIFSKNSKYIEILDDIDYFYQYFTDFISNTNNFFAMPISFNGIFSNNIKLTNEINETNIMDLFENIKNTHMLDLSILLENCKRTLYSIRQCIKVINISDALTLFRRFKDDLFLFIYFVRLSKPKPDDYDTSKKLSEWNKYVEDAQNWANNRMKDVYYTNIIKLLKKNKLIKQLDTNINMFQYLTDVTKKLNNHAHSNGMYFLNDSSPINNRKRSVILLEHINIELRTVIAYLFTILFYLAPKYLMASDFADYKEANLEPPKGCQYLVASFHQCFIDNILNKVNPKLKAFLKSNTSMLIK